MLIGLTGGIASGKSAVAELLAGHGAVIVDSDAIAREVVEPGTPALAAIQDRFGAQALQSDGTLDRARLAGIIFSDPDARADLDAIVHPAVRARASELIDQAPSGSVVVRVIPLLVETGQAGSFDLVVVVEADPDTQLRRLRARDGLTEAQARARIDAQATPAQRRAAADVIVRNDGDPSELRTQVDALWRQLRSASGRGSVD